MSTSLAAATRRPAVRLDVDRRLSSCSRASTSTTRPARSHTIITKVHPKGTAHQSSCDEATTAATPVKSRRDVLALAALLANTTPLAALAADDDDDLDDDAAQAAVEASMKDVLSKNSGEISYPRRAAFDGAFGVDGVKAASFEVSNLWDVAPVVQDVTGESGFPATARWGEIVDPVNGKVAVEARVFVTKGFPKQSIADLGKPENVPVAKALGLDKYDDSYRRADMLGSYKRVDKNDGDRVYYDWEMVASAAVEGVPERGGVPVPCAHLPHVRHRRRRRPVRAVVGRVSGELETDGELAQAHTQLIHGQHAGDCGTGGPQRGHARGGSRGRHVVSVVYQGESDERTLLIRHIQCGSSS